MEGECFYHLCKKKGLVTECPHCKQEFCEQHKKAVAPHGPMRMRDTAEDRMARLDEDRSHPCAPYVTWKAEQDKAAGAKYQEYLDELKSKPKASSSRRPKKSSHVYEDEEDESYEPITSAFEGPVPLESLIILFIILAIIAIGSIAYYFLVKVPPPTTPIP